MSNNQHTPLSDAVRDIAALQAEVLERVRHNEQRDLDDYSTERGECPSCGAPLYDGEPCCEGDGE